MYEGCLIPAWGVRFRFRASDFDPPIETVLLRTRYLPGNIYAEQSGCLCVQRLEQTPRPPAVVRGRAPRRDAPSALRLYVATMCIGILYKRFAQRAVPPATLAYARKDGNRRSTKQIDASQATCKCQVHAPPRKTPRTLHAVRTYPR